MASLHQPKHILLGDLETAEEELYAALDAVEQARIMLLALPEYDEMSHAAELEALWQQLNDLGRPLVTVGACIISAMRQIGTEIGASPTAPDQLEWLLGVDVQAEQRARERQQNADALLKWIEPYLERVSARTRTAVTRAIVESAQDEAVARLLRESLTPETFLRDLQKERSGFVANIRGLGPRGLRELREALDVPE
jgi:hypothetical protein